VYTNIGNLTVAQLFAYSAVIVILINCNKYIYNLYYRIRSKIILCDTSQIETGIFIIILLFIV